MNSSKQPQQTKATSTAHSMHLSIAETGKLKALKGNHTDALQHYREALRLAVSSKAPEVFFRHYTQCVLESLELTEAYDDIIQYCINADKHYQSLGLTSSIHKRDHSSILERLGLVQLKTGDVDSAHATLDRAKEIAGKNVLPITEEILNWLKRGFSVDNSRILSSQRKHNYFVVRASQVAPQRATAIKTEKHAGLFDPSKILSE